MNIITEQQKKELESRSAKGMPARPGDRGWTSDQIVRKLYEPTMFLCQLLESFEIEVKKIIDGYTPEDGEPVKGVLEEIGDIKTRLQDFGTENFTSAKAIADQHGDVIDTTYLKILDLTSGLIGAKKYLNNSGQIAGNIYDIATAVQNSVNAFNQFVQNNFRNGVAEHAILADRATGDVNGAKIDTTYATIVALTAAVAETNKIKNGQTTVEKASKDANGDVINSTYLKVANIINALNDTSTNKALSAYQGKLLQDQITSIQALLQSDDTSLDELQEIVTYIKQNKSLIDGITSAKISYTDIIDNYTSNVSGKPASARVTYLLKGLIDDIVNGVTKVKKAENADKLGEHDAAEYVRGVNGISPDEDGNIGLAGFVSFNVVEQGDNKILQVSYQGDIGGTFSLVDVGDNKYLVFTPSEA